MAGCFLFFVFSTSVWEGAATITPLSPLLTSSKMIKSSSASGSRTGAKSSSSSLSFKFSTAIAILITFWVLSPPNHCKIALAIVKSVNSSECRVRYNVWVQLYQKWYSEYLGHFYTNRRIFFRQTTQKCNEEVQLHSSYRVKNGHSQFDTAALSRVNVCPIRTLVGSDIPHGL